MRLGRGLDRTGPIRLENELIVTPGSAALVAVAGLFAGAINAAVGSGTLISYPALLAAGLPPVPANATNNIGVLFGSISATASYRPLLRDRWSRLRWGVVAAGVGGAAGAGLVLALPTAVFAAVVPWLIVLAVVLVAVQGRMSNWLRRALPNAHGSSSALALVALPTGVYGGYFGAGQGVILMGLLGITYDADVQRANGAKNLLAATANGTAAVVFAFSGRVNWEYTGILAIAAIIGGTIGGQLARRARPAVLRVLVILVGLVAAGSLLLRG